MSLDREQKKFILDQITERCPSCGDRAWYVIDIADSRKPTLGPPCPNDQDLCTCAYIQCGDCAAEFKRYVPPFPR